MRYAWHEVPSRRVGETWMGRKADEIVVSLLEPLHAMARRVATSREEAEDIVQDTCIRALRNAAAIEAHPCPRAYLFRILRNLSHDRRRRTLTSPRLVSMENLRGDDGELPQFTAGPQDVHRVVSNSLGEDMQAALDALPEPFRKVLWLREIDGLTYDELSVVLGVPTGTVRSRLSRARKRMMDSLSQQAEPPKPRRKKGAGS